MRPADPRPVERAPFRARRDVVEHEFVRAVVAVTAREAEDVARDAMVAEPQALDDLAVAHVEAGNYAAGKNGAISLSGIRSSIKARPLMAQATPVAASACRSVASRTPPDACQAMAGKRRTHSR
jgi:hypothetical protein